VFLGPASLKPRTEFCGRLMENIAAAVIGEELGAARQILRG